MTEQKHTVKHYQMMRAVDKLDITCVGNYKTVWETVHIQGQCKGTVCDY